MNGVNTDSPHASHVVSLMDRANRRVRRETAARIDWTEFSDLKPWHMPLLSHTPDAGGRPTELARRIHVSKQALTQLIRELSAGGYVELLPDASDGRARIVRRTSRGDAALENADAAIARLEADWSARIGAGRYHVFREVLGLLADADAERWAER
jgi:DNA-binding MarR family transcriptional regulator